MKILHAAEVVKGGVATVLNELLNDQCKRSDVSEIIILCPCNEFLELNIKHEKIKVFLFNKKRRGVRSIVNFSKKFGKVYIDKKPDVVHLHSSFAGVFGRIVARCFFNTHRAKMVYCPHAFYFLTAGRLKSFFSKLIEKLLSRFCDKIICVSEHERKSALDAGIDEEKLLTIYNGVRVKSAEGIIKKGYVNSKKINILFVGRLEKQKGFDVLLSAFEKLNGNEKFFLTVVGEGRGKNIGNKSSNVNYKGWLRGEDLEKQYERADVVVVPSRWEGFAMVPLEAMMYSLPIIASDNTSLPEVVINGTNGFLFPTGDIDKLYELLSSLDKKELFIMGERGRSILENKFQSKDMVDHTFCCYVS